MNVSELYPNSPTPNLPVTSWDFDPGYDLTLHGAYANYLFTELNIYLNSASIIGGLAVIIIVLLLRSYDPKLVDRVSLRLTVVISAVDVIKAAAYIVFTFVQTPGVWCEFTAWLVLFLTNYYTFLSAAIAFNLQWVFLQRKPVFRWLEAMYFAVSLTLALVTSIPAWAGGRLGLDPNYGVCWYISYSSKRTILWEYLTFLGWNLIGTIYCVLIVILVVLQLRANTRKLYAFSAMQVTSNSVRAFSRTRKTQRTLNKLVARISLYALIPIVTQGGWYLNELIFQNGHYLNFGVDFWCIVGTDLPGVFNLMAFSLDPALANSISYIKNDLIQRYGHDEGQKRPEDISGKERFLIWFTRTFLRYPDDRTSSQGTSGGQSTKVSSHQATTIIEDDGIAEDKMSGSFLPVYDGEEPPASNRVSLASLYEMQRKSDEQMTAESDLVATISVNARRRTRSIDEAMKRVLRGL